MTTTHAAGLACPHCGFADQVQSVVSIVASGTHSTYGSSSMSAVGFTRDGIVPVFGSSTSYSTSTSVLAASLAPEPAPRISSAATWAVLLGACALLITLMGFAVLWEDIIHPKDSASLIGAVGAPLLLPGPFTAGFLAAFLTARANGRFNRRIANGRETGYRIWSSGWYCHRCAGAYWPQAPAPHIPARQLLYPDHFRHYVWTTAGY